MNRAESSDSSRMSTVSRLSSHMDMQGPESSQPSSSGFSPRTSNRPLVPTLNLAKLTPVHQAAAPSLNTNNDPLGFGTAQHLDEATTFRPPTSHITGHSKPYSGSLTARKPSFSNPGGPDANVASTSGNTA
eukprot:scaffold253069_cov52-Prasinocladus_malaysianus.AAC.1